jgi:AcrR family transcriptional regulator
MLDSMSSGDPQTRRRILDSVRALMEERPGAPIAMGAVAERAGVSRQALYLHFTDRTALFVEASRLLDATERTPTKQGRVDDAPNGLAALREAVALQARIKPALHGVATALDSLRRTDPAAKATFSEREHARLDRCEDVIRRLDNDGRLADGWDVATAARLMWVLTSQRAWEDLVIDQRWSRSRYVNHVSALLEAGFVSPEPRSSTAT